VAGRSTADGIADASRIRQQVSSLFLVFHVDETHFRSR
jgi:hypothetical protein